MASIYHDHWGASYSQPPCEHAPALSLLPFGNPVRISGCIEKQNGTYWNRKSTRAPRRTSKKRDAGDNHETAAGIDRHRPPTSAQRPHPEPCGVRSAEPTDRGSRRHCADVGERRLVLYGALFRGRGAFFRALRGHPRVTKRAVRRWQRAKVVRLRDVSGRGNPPHLCWPLLQRHFRRSEELCVLSSLTGT